MQEPPRAPAAGFKTRLRCCGECSGCLREVGGAMRKRVFWVNGFADVGREGQGILPPGEGRAAVWRWSEPAVLCRGLYKTDGETARVST